MRTTTRLKQLMAARTAATVPGAANALFARVIEDLGFDAVYVTGAGVANMHLGAPDIGLTTLTELAHATAAIADSVELPIIVDADTGFGRPVVANVFGGKTPDPGRAALADMGFAVVLYANAALQAALRASYEVLGALKKTGSLASVADRLTSFEERQRSVAKHRWDVLETRYKTPDSR